jgi:hypothetical protein
MLRTKRSANLGSEKRPSSGTQCLPIKEKVGKHAPGEYENLQLSYRSAL